MYLQAVDCGPLLAPNNGTKTGDKTTFLNEVIFHCDDGHDLKGSSSRVCQANKQWSGEETSCEGENHISYIHVVMSCYKLRSTVVVI